MAGSGRCAGLLSADVRAELALDARAGLGEGPLWDPRTSSLHWVDVMAGRVHTFAPGSGQDRGVDLGVPVGALALRDRGGLVAAAQGGFFAVQPESEPELLAAVAAGDDSIRMNDGECDPHGRFWAGSMDTGAADGAGALVVLTADGVRTALQGLTIPNGLAWAPDGASALFVDSPTHRVDRLEVDVDAANVVGRRPFAAIPDDVLPDGMTVDAEGGVWVALWGGWGVQRFDEQGRPDGFVDVPAAQVTSVTFGGDDLMDLYVTTAADGLNESDKRDQPHAGGVFHCRPGVRGRAAYRVAA